MVFITTTFFDKPTQFLYLSFGFPYTSTLDCGTNLVPGKKFPDKKLYTTFLQSFASFQEFISPTSKVMRVFSPFSIALGNILFHAVYFFG